MVEPRRAPGSEVDVLSAARWPSYYPSLEGLRTRASHADGLPPVASGSDQLLILAAEAVTGRPLAKVLRRARPLLEPPDERARLDRVAAAEGLRPLAAIVADPDRRSSAGVAGDGSRTRPRSRPRCDRPRLAGPCAKRMAGRLGRRRRRRERGVLVTLSGMDGAGKSTLTRAVRAHLEAAGLPAHDEIVRIGAPPARSTGSPRR